ncbi:MAG: hypothetical protein HC862_23480 [Scytonema sp. RU_4_4]|nr:hypothetical protein [Scytonema sp. RU_4_4]NJR76459.1 hypothetical protein [Scytonema sp. CRU_2_7]
MQYFKELRNRTLDADELVLDPNENRYIFDRTGRMRYLKGGQSELGNHASQYFSHL